MKNYTKRAKRLRQLYNHANVLHNAAWEAKHLFEIEINKTLGKCKTKAEFNAKLGEFEELIHCMPWEFPENPKPKRTHSHSGNASIGGFLAFSFASGLPKE